MKKTYKIEVDCANCAQKMEDAANTVAGVAGATVINVSNREPFFDIFSCVRRQNPGLV